MRTATHRLMLQLGADAFDERLIAGSVGLAKALAGILWVKTTGDFTDLIFLAVFSRNQEIKLKHFWQLKL